MYKECQAAEVIATPKDCQGAAKQRPEAPRSKLII